MRSEQFTDGSAGDAHYSQVGIDCARYRRPDPAIARYIDDALSDAHIVLNVGAGAGSYEPGNREVAAIKPSSTMRVQRPPDRP